MSLARRLIASDGAEIALHRMRAHRDGRPAVLLVHGAFSGHTVWLRNGRARDGSGVFPGCHGFDVWLADLRGHGASAREPTRFHWRFEDWILEDTPTLVARWSKKPAARRSSGSGIRRAGPWGCAGWRVSAAPRCRSRRA